MSCDILDHVADEIWSNKWVFAKWVNWRTYFLVYHRCILYVQLKVAFLMCVSLETTSEVIDDQARNQLGTPGGAKSFLVRGLNFLNCVQ